MKRCLNTIFSVLLLLCHFNSTAQVTADCTLGAPCDDGNFCTINDTYDADCNCISGDIVIADCDPDCDLGGTPCDDGNHCTINDYYSFDCNCIGGTVLDNCDPDCDLVGQPCDDGNPCTVSDYYDISCNCGSDAVVPDCDPTPTCVEGEPCDDSPCVTESYYDADCNCLAVLDPNCNPDCDLVGQPCDDGDPCTVSDYYDVDCNCGSDAIDPDCGDCVEGEPCDDGNFCTVGDYYDADCNCISGDAVIADCDPDCDLGGTPCDDGNHCTINDYYSFDCNCTGGTVLDNCDPDCDLVGQPCDDGDPCTVSDYYDISCNCGSDAVVPDCDPTPTCVEGEPCDDSPCVTESFYDADCNCLAIVDPNCNPDCDLVGQPCDDGDPCTVSDYYDVDCNCTSDAIDFDCGGNGNCTVGAPCSDGNPCTLLDTYDADCNCISGELQDDDNDGICNADDPTNGDCTLNAPCDDSPCVLESFYDADCNCLAVLDPNCNPDCDLVGQPCDDGDPCTVSDYYDVDCNCTSDAIDFDCGGNGNGACVEGEPCDDGSCVVESFYDADCNCLAVLDPNCNPDCDLVGQPCDDGDPCTVSDYYDVDCNCTSDAIDFDCLDGITYCETAAQKSTYEHIETVVLASINNNSGNDGGYGDYTSLSTNLAAGNTYEITLTPGYAGSAYREYWKVWIDYNADGDFNDSGEEVVKARARGMVSKSFTVPDGTPQGVKRMRIAMKYGGYAEACTGFTYGEVEDYSIIIGTTIGTEPVEGETNTCTDGIQNGNETGIDCGGDSCDPCLINYCEGFAKRSLYEYIDAVQIGTINNVSGNNDGYGNFSNLSTDLAQGEMYTATLTAGYKGSSYREYWTVWIDLNQDGDFEDSGEVLGKVIGKDAVTMSFEVPSNAQLGETRMRIAMKYGGHAASACGSFTYGEVEDYTINITANNGGELNKTEPSILTTTAIIAPTAYPNPVMSDHAQVTVDFGSHAIQRMQVMTITGELIFSQSYSQSVSNQETQLNIGDWLNGVYVIQLEDQSNQVHYVKLIKL